MTSPYLTLKARTEAQARQDRRNTHPNRGAAARRLRDAAPELLAALIDAEDRMAVVLENDADEGKPEDAALVTAFKAARAAIAKATCP